MVKSFSEKVGPGCKIESLYTTRTQKEIFVSMLTDIVPSTTLCLKPWDNSIIAVIVKKHDRLREGNFERRKIKEQMDGKRKQ